MFLFSIFTQFNLELLDDFFANCLTKIVWSTKIIGQIYLSFWKKSSQKSHNFPSGDRNKLLGYGSQWNTPIYNIMVKYVFILYGMI